MFMHAQKGKVVAAPTTTSEYHPVPRLSLFRAQQNNSKQVRWWEIFVERKDPEAEGPPVLQTGERATNSEEKVVFLSYYFFWVQIQFPNTENGNNQKAKGKWGENGCRHVSVFDRQTRTGLKQINQEWNLLLIHNFGRTISFSSSLMSKSENTKNTKPNLLSLASIVTSQICCWTFYCFLSIIPPPPSPKPRLLGLLAPVKKKGPPLSASSTGHLPVAYWPTNEESKGAVWTRYHFFLPSLSLFSLFCFFLSQHSAHLLLLHLKT